MAKKYPVRAATSVGTCAQSVLIILTRFRKVKMMPGMYKMDGVFSYNRKDMVFACGNN